MKLYVWNEPYPVAYGSSCLYAVAGSEEEAREIAKAAVIREYGFGHGQERLGEVKLGAPDRVLDVPCAEVYQWSE